MKRRNRKQMKEKNEVKRQDRGNIFNYLVFKIKLWNVMVTFGKVQRIHQKECLLHRYWEHTNTIRERESKLLVTKLFFYLVTTNCFHQWCMLHTKKYAPVEVTHFSHTSLTACAHILCLISVYVHQVTINVNGCNYFCIEEFNDTCGSYALTCQMPFCKNVAQLLYLTKKNNYGLLTETSKLNHHTIKKYLQHYII